MVSRRDAKSAEISFDSIVMKENEISKTLVDVFIRVHSELGPGLLESVYETAICHELTKRGLNFTKQQGISVYYDSVKMDMGFRADVIVENKVIIEIKSIEALLPVHHKTLLTYLKLTKLKLGLLVNFNTNLVKEGLVRIVNRLEE